jgi:outer membrane protein assembly factor BamB
MSVSLDILLGSSWKVDARCLARLYAYRPGDEGFDFGPIVDIIDIVVDGANVTSRLPEESIFCVMHELIGGLCTLIEGRLDKHLVAFAEAGWELAVQRAEDDFEISFYGTEGPRDVSLHNVRVSRDRLLNAVRAATEHLIDDLVDLNHAFSQDHLVRSLERQLRQLNRQRRHRAPARPLQIPGGIERVTLGTGAHDLRFELEFDGRHPDFWRYEGALVSDLHSLLFTGDLTLHYWGRRRVVARSAYLFPLVEAMTAGAERFLQTLERRHGSCVLLDGSGSSEAMLTVDISDPEHVHLRIAEPHGSVGRTHTTPVTLFGVLVDTVRRFLDAITELNPRQVLNHRVNDLRSRLERLRGQFHDVRRGDQYFDGVQGYLRAAPAIEPERAEQGSERRMGYPLAEFRHVFLRTAWYLARHRLDFASVAAVDDQLLVPSDGQLECLDRRTGEVRWVAACKTHLGPAEAVALLGNGSRLDAVARADGSRRWSAELRGSAAGALSFRLAEDAVVSVIEDGVAVVIFDLRTGSPRWRFEVEHGEIVGTVLAGPVLVAVTDDGFAYGLTPATGALLWKVRVPGTCLLPPVVHQGRLYVCADSDVGIEGALYSIYPLTGRRVFERRAPATFSQPPLFLDGMGLFTFETPAHATVAALDLEDGRALWSLGLENAQIDTPVLTWIDGPGRGTLVVKTDTGECLGIDPDGGHVRWRTPLLDPGDILLSNLRPALIDGHLAVAERYVSVLDPATGARRHRFTDLPEHPCYLQVDDDLRLILGDGDDHLECFDLSGFLALVD